MTMMRMSESLMIQPHMPDFFSFLLSFFFLFISVFLFSTS
jgi:hypothetical protein